MSNSEANTTYWLYLKLKNLIAHLEQNHMIKKDKYSIPTKGGMRNSSQLDNNLKRKIQLCSFYLRIYFKVEKKVPDFRLVSNV